MIRARRAAAAAAAAAAPANAEDDLDVRIEQLLTVAPTLGLELTAASPLPQSQSHNNPSQQSNGGHFDPGSPNGPSSMASPMHSQPRQRPPRAQSPLPQSMGGGGGGGGGGLPTSDSLPGGSFTDPFMVGAGATGACGTAVKADVLDSTSAVLKSGDASGLQKRWMQMNRSNLRLSYAVLLVCLGTTETPELSGRHQCWLDPMLASAKVTGKGSKAVVEELERQYSSVLRAPGASRSRGAKLQFRSLGDPTKPGAERELAEAARRVGDKGRILIHYNGHGMPLVTQQFAELWVFSESYQEYLPIKIGDFVNFTRNAAGLFIFDCSRAGQLLNQWLDQKRHQQFHDQGYGQPVGAAPDTSGDFREDWKQQRFLCACSSDETLPQNPNLPGDFFTACLTTPVRAALCWYREYTRRDSLLPDVTWETFSKVNRSPDLSRRTPEAELNDMLKVITETIAWCTMRPSEFYTLFCHDASVATLYRNFLLADRLMRDVGCTPRSFPEMAAEAHRHPLWGTWDFAFESVLTQIPALARDNAPQYQPSRFTRDQLVAFEVWLVAGDRRQRPEQLPAVKHALTQGIDREFALGMLCRYFQRGAEAVEYALACGLLKNLTKLLLDASVTEVQFLVMTLFMGVLHADPEIARTELLWGVNQKELTKPVDVLLSILDLTDKDVTLVPLDEMLAEQPAPQPYALHRPVAANTAGPLGSPAASVSCFPTCGPRFSATHPNGNGVAVPGGNATTSVNPQSPLGPGASMRMSPVPAALPSGNGTHSGHPSTDAMAPCGGQAHAGGPASASSKPTADREDSSPASEPQRFFVLPNVTLSDVKCIASFLLCNLMLGPPYRPHDRLSVVVPNMAVRVCRGIPGQPETGIVRLCGNMMGDENENVVAWGCLLLGRALEISDVCEAVMQEVSRRRHLFDSLLRHARPKVRACTCFMLAKLFPTRVDRLPSAKQADTMFLLKQIFRHFVVHSTGVSSSVRMEAVHAACEVLHCYRHLVPEYSFDKLDSFKTQRFEALGGQAAERLESSLAKLPEPIDLSDVHLFPIPNPPPPMAAGSSEIQSRHSGGMSPPPGASSAPRVPKPNAQGHPPTAHELQMQMQLAAASIAAAAPPVPAQQVWVPWSADWEPVGEDITHAVRNIVHDAMVLLARAVASDDPRVAAAADQSLRKLRANERPASPCVANEGLALVLSLDDDARLSASEQKRLCDVKNKDLMRHGVLRRQETKSMVDAWANGPLAGSAAAGEGGATGTQASTTSRGSHGRSGANASPAAAAASTSSMPNAGAGNRGGGGGGTGLNASTSQSMASPSANASMVGDRTGTQSLSVNMMGSQRALASHARPRAFVFPVFGQSASHAGPNANGIGAGASSPSLQRGGHGSANNLTRHGSGSGLSDTRRQAQGAGLAAQSSHPVPSGGRPRTTSTGAGGAVVSGSGIMSGTAGLLNAHDAELAASGVDVHALNNGAPIIAAAFRELEQQLWSVDAARIVRLVSFDTLTKPKTRAFATLSSGLPPVCSVHAVDDYSDRPLALLVFKSGEVALYGGDLSSINSLAYSSTPESDDEMTRLQNYITFEATRDTRPDDPPVSLYRPKDGTLAITGLRGTVHRLSLEAQCELESITVDDSRIVTMAEGFRGADTLLGTADGNVRLIDERCRRKATIAVGGAVTGLSAVHDPSGASGPDRFVVATPNTMLLYDMRMVGAAKVVEHAIGSKAPVQSDFSSTERQNCDANLGAWSAGPLGLTHRSDTAAAGIFSHLPLAVTLRCDGSSEFLAVSDKGIRRVAEILAPDSAAAKRASAVSIAGGGGGGVTNSGSTSSRNPSSRDATGAGVGSSLPVYSGNFTQPMAGSGSSQYPCSEAGTVGVVGASGFPAALAVHKLKPVALVGSHLVALAQDGTRLTNSLAL